MSSVFTKIINGELPCHKIAEDDRHFAFMEIKPLAPGHALVIPKAEVDYIFDLDDQALANLMVFAKKVAAAIKQSVPCVKIAVLVYGLEVRHAHVHLVPVQGVPGELNLSNAKKSTDAELGFLAQKIRSYLE